MSIKNEDVVVMVKEKFKSMQGHLNIMESELMKDSEDLFNRPLVAMSFGKISKLYEDITYLMGIFDDKPKYK